MNSYTEKLKNAENEETVRAVLNDIYKSISKLSVKLKGGYIVQKISFFISFVLFLFYFDKQIDFYAIPSSFKAFCIIFLRVFAFSILFSIIINIIWRLLTNLFSDRGLSRNKGIRDCFSETERALRRSVFYCGEVSKKISCICGVVIALIIMYFFRNSLIELFLDAVKEGLLAIIFSLIVVILMVALFYFVPFLVFRLCFWILDIQAGMFLNGKINELNKVLDRFDEIWAKYDSAKAQELKEIQERIEKAQREEELAKENKHLFRDLPIYQGYLAQYRGSEYLGTSTSFKTVNGGSPVYKKDGNYVDSSGKRVYPEDMYKP